MKWGLVLPPAPLFLGSLPGQLSRSNIPEADQVKRNLAIPFLPSRVAHPGISAVMGPHSSFRQNIATLANSLSQFLCPKAPVPPDGLESGSGTGFRLCLTLLPRSPCLRFRELSSFRTDFAATMAMTNAFFRFRSAAVGHNRRLSLPTESHKRKRMALKVRRNRRDRLSSPPRCSEWHSRTPPAAALPR